MGRLTVVLAILAVSLVAATAAAQGTGLASKGIKVGLSAYSFGGEDSDAVASDWATNSRMGLAVGGFVTFALGPDLALQPELLYVMKGAGHERGADRRKFNLSYVDLPVLLKYRFATTGSTRANLFAGPVVSAALSAKIVSYVGPGWQPQEVDISYGVRDLDFGMAVGGGLDFAMSGGTLTIDGRYVFPMTRWSDYVENEDPVLTNQGFLLMAGVGF